MKRIFCLLSIIILSSSTAFSAVLNTDMTNAVYMKNQGYSQESIRIINAQIYSPYRDKETNTGKRSTFWRKVNAYIDPAYDDRAFGTKDYDFTNRWSD